MKIALVDNNQFDLNLYGRYLVRNGFEVYLFLSGYDLFSCEIEFDIILLDLALPDLDGISIAEELRARETPAHIGFLTGQEIDKTLIHIADELGIEKIFMKSAHFNELAESLRKWNER